MSKKIRKLKEINESINNVLAKLETQMFISNTNSTNRPINMTVPKNVEIK